MTEPREPATTSVRPHRRPAGPAGAQRIGMPEIAREMTSR